MNVVVSFRNRTLGPYSPGQNASTDVLGRDLASALRAPADGVVTVTESINLNDLQKLRHDLRHLRIVAVR